MGQKYAVLISGQAVETQGFDEFWNDVVLMREALQKQGFQDNRIYILYGAGTDYSNINRTAARYRPNPAITNFAATIAKVTSVFNGLATGTNNLPKLTDDDLLFVWTFDHGNGPPDIPGPNCYLCLTDGDMQDTTFANLVNQIPHAYRVFCMQQCHSGGFIDDLQSDRTVILTACRDTEYGHGTDTERELISNIEYSHGEFNFHLLAALNGQDPLGTAVNADADGNSFVTMREIFDYIRSHDSIDGSIHPQTIEHPQYDDGTLSLGDRLHLSFADIFIRDNLQDKGMEPLAYASSCSPDINHFRNKLADPQAYLCSAAAKNQDNLFEDVEFGQPNYIYVRLQNRGYSASDADVDIYWAEGFSTLPTPNSWHNIGNIKTPSINPGDFIAAGPLEWEPDAPVGHHCFIAVLGNAQDPKPDLNSVHNIDDFYDLVRQRNNVCWKNFEVKDLFPNTYYKLDFYIQGWPRISYKSDLEIIASKIPAGSNIELRLLKRLTEGAISQGMTLTKETATYCTYSVDFRTNVALRNMPLKTSDKSQATLGITLPKNAPDGIYQISALQRINGKEMGRITQNLRVGKYPYMGNWSTKELHIAGCDWAAKISPRNKVAYSDVGLALKRGYNGCRFCMPEIDTDK